MRLSEDVIRITFLHICTFIFYVFECNGRFYLLAEGSPNADGVGRVRGERGFDAISVDVESNGGPRFPVILSVIP